MTVAYFIYLILYVTIMTCVFLLGGVMLWPKTRVIFKRPVPHIHDTLGMLFLAWGMSYLIFLPCIYMQINHDSMHDFAYNVISMLTGVMTLSVGTWSLMCYLQQKVNLMALQALIVTGPLVLSMSYIVFPAEFILLAYSALTAVEVAGFLVYYIIMYRRFALDLKINYSHIDENMLHGLWVQWTVMGLTTVIFVLCVVRGTLFWDIADIVSNFVAISVFVYTSEHLMIIAGPSQVKQPDEVPVQDNVYDIATMLRKDCEEKLVFCNPELTLADLAATIGTNRTYLGIWFSENGTTFYQYINTLRVRHAAALLLDTSLTIGHVQTESGFTNRATFGKYFTEFYGCTPSEYRQKKAGESKPTATQE